MFLFLFSWPLFAPADPLDPDEAYLTMPTLADCEFVLNGLRQELDHSIEMQHALVDPAYQADWDYYWAARVADDRYCLESWVILRQAQWMMAPLTPEPVPEDTMCCWRKYARLYLVELEKKIGCEAYRRKTMPLPAGWHD